MFYVVLLSLFEYTSHFKIYLDCFLCVLAAPLKIGLNGEESLPVIALLT